ncbi:hypothetical protein D9M68_647630 [compost metagenome]
MERHAALPQVQHLEGMRQVVRGLVEQHIAQPPAQHHAQHAIEDEVFQVAHIERRGVAAGDPPAAQQVHQGKADEIHQPVPVNGKRPDLQGDGVEFRILQHVLPDTMKLNDNNRRALKIREQASQLPWVRPPCPRPMADRRHRPCRTTNVPAISLTASRARPIAPCITRWVTRKPISTTP